MKFREVADGEQTGCWQIRLFGDFRLIGPDRRTHNLRNRKCEGLIALLSAALPNAVRRDFVAAALWPDKSGEKQLESLRQAISIVRRQIDGDFITSTRTDCRLSNRVRFECDLFLRELRDDVTFMPAQDGDWFETMRAQEQSGPAEDEEPTVMSHYLQSLRWFARSDPKTLFAFFRANRAMVRGISPTEILGLLNQAGNPGGVSGWPDFWRGIAEDDLNFCGTLLRRALRSAVKEQDWELASDTCFELGKTYCRRGEIHLANRVSRAADEVAVRANTKAARVNAARLKGTLLVHWGETKSGLELLRTSTEMVDDPVRRALLESTQAWFETVSGLYGTGAKRLEVGESLCRETGHHQALMLTSATRAMLAIHEGSRKDAIPHLERVARQCYEAGSCQFGVYAEESLAKLHLLDHDRGLAAANLNSARLNRVRSHMAKTPLESSMVAAIC